MSTFTWAPDYDAENNIKPTVETVKFGDGYEQRQARGINISRQNWNLVFSNLDSATMTSITAFLDATNGVTSFDWTPPGGSAGKYVCAGYKNKIGRGNLYTVSTAFMQVFEP